MDERAFHHGRCDFPRNRAVPRDHSGRNAEHRGFGIIAVSDETRFENVAAAGHVCEQRSQDSARAAFCCRQADAIFREPVHHRSDPRLVRFAQDGGESISHFPAPQGPGLTSGGDGRFLFLLVQPGQKGPLCRVQPPWAGELA